MKNKILPLIILTTDNGKKERAMVPGIGELIEYIPKLYSYDVVIKRLRGNKENWNKLLKLYGINIENIANNKEKFKNLDRKKSIELSEILDVISGYSIDDFSSQSFLSKFSSKNKLEDILPYFNENLSLLLGENIQLEKALEINLNELFKPELLASIKLSEYEIKKLNNFINKIKLNNFEKASYENLIETNFLDIMENSSKNKKLIEAYTTLNNKYPTLFDEKNENLIKEKIDHIIGNKYSEGISSIFTDDFLDNDDYTTRKKIINALIGLSKYKNLFTDEKTLNTEKPSHDTINDIIKSFNSNKEKILKVIKKDLLKKTKEIKNSLVEEKQKNLTEYKKLLNEDIKNILSDKFKILSNYGYSEEEIKKIEENLYKEIKKIYNTFKRVANTIEGETEYIYHTNMKNIVSHFLKYKNAEHYDDYSEYNTEHYINYLEHEVINKAFLKAIKPSEKYSMNNKNNVKIKSSLS